MIATHSGNPSVGIWKRCGAVAVACSILWVPLGEAQKLDPASGYPQGFEEIAPGEALDRLAQETKVRWRQMYREPQLSPSTERVRVSFTLGGLVADCYLAVKAGDAQQIKNVNQDIMKYCGALGLAEKLNPRIHSASRLAESEDWNGVRKEISEGQGTIEKLLVEQRDRDLAILVDLGMWSRLLEISAGALVDDPAVKNKSLAIGSTSLLNYMADRYQHISPAVRDDDPVIFISNVVTYLQKHWSDDSPTAETVAVTLEKLKFLNARMSVK